MSHPNSAEVTINQDIPYATWDKPGYHGTTSNVSLRKAHEHRVVVQHGRQSGVANSSLAGHMESTMPAQDFMSGQRCVHVPLQCSCIIPVRHESNKKAILGLCQRVF